MREAGAQEQRWDGTNDRGEAAPSGVYFLRIEAEGVLASRKLVLIR
jgi:flagellar hook assembly protein FlgD